MFLVGIFQWWYGSGWLRHFKRSYVGILRTANLFSIGLLLRTLFNPFRQISAGSVRGGLPEQLRAFADRSISRFIGANIRFWTIIVGMIAITIRMVWVALSVIIWTILPIMPFVGLIFWLKGVVL